MGSPSAAGAYPSGPTPPFVMEAHRSEATVGGDGSVTVHGVPFPAGEAVEVIVLPAASAAPAEPKAERPRRQFGSAKGLITIPDDFGDPIEGFEDYM